MSTTISGFQESGHAEEFGRWTESNAYAFRVFFTLSGDGFSQSYATYVIAPIPDGDKSISTRAHIHMKHVAFQQAVDRLRSVFEEQGPKAVSELKQLDLRIKA